MLKKSERLVWILAIGVIPPTVGFLALWWGSLPLVAEGYIFLWAGLGLLLGLLIDFKYLRKWILKTYAGNLKIWLAIYGFYSVCFFGFFMGVPVFNLALAVPAGFLAGSKLARRNASAGQIRQLSQKMCLATTIIMAVVCLTSAVIALVDPYTGANLQGMFNLNFTVTPAMIMGIIGVGGTTLLGLQWWLTSTTIRLAYRLSRAGR